MPGPWRAVWWGARADTNTGGQEMPREWRLSEHKTLVQSIHRGGKVSRPSLWSFPQCLGVFQDACTWKN